VLNLSREDKRHPVRAYLDGVQPTWDDKPRIDTWLIDYAGAEDPPFNRAVGAIWMIAAVRRVRQPGCKFDNMMVLESAEGSGKSTLGAILANGWFSDCLPIDAESREVIEQTRGKWIIEFAELRDIKVKAVENVKSFLSRREDSARAAYAKMRSDVKRQFVTMGSTNDKNYLMGTTGNRRFWPVAVGTIDLDGLKRDKDQLWAEAAVREAASESITLPEDLWGVGKEIQESRRIVHPLEQRLVDEVGDRVGIIAVNDLLATIGISTDNIYKASAQHGFIIKAAMERLGWKQTRRRINGKMTSIYHRGDSELQWVWAVSRLIEAPGQTVKHPAGRVIAWKQAANMH
jgi:Virulence-associated protein E